MKPNKPLAKKSDYDVVSIPVKIGRKFITDLHYTHSAPRVAVAMHGLFRKDTGELVGVAQWLPPIKAAALSVSDDWRSVLSLSRLVVMDTEPQNAESILLGWSIRKISKDDPRWRHLLTYADTGQSHPVTGEEHTGTIYRATNWRELPAGKPQPRWVDPTTGAHVARKSTTSRTVKEMKELGYVQTGRTKKRKFLYDIRGRKT
jgi:hypothetical protein